MRKGLSGVASRGTSAACDGIEHVVARSSSNRDVLSGLREARLGSEFFTRDVVTVAQALLGTVLVHGRRAAIIVETEAYLGPGDLASHTRFGKTARTSVMFGPGGVAYVYLCY